MSFTQILQFIIVGGALQGILLAFLLFTRKTNQLANRLLGALIFLMSMQSILVAFDTREFFITFPHLSKVSWLIPLFFGPLLYLFTRKITSRVPRFKQVDVIHFIPAVITFFYLLPYYLKSAADKIAYLNDFETARKDDFGLIGQATLFQILFYLVYSLKALYRYERKIFDTYSELEKIRLQWVKQFIYSILSIFFVAAIAFYAKKWYVPVFTEIYHYHLHYLMVVALVYWIGYKALAQPQVFVNRLVAAFPAPTNINLENSEGLIEKEPLPTPAQELYDLETNEDLGKKYQKSSLKPEESQKYLNRLLDYMEEEKPYRQSNITIQDLAALLQIPKHHLSQIINNKLDKNFYDFINQYRVAEAQLLLVDPKFKHLTNLAIAEEAGFNSKATFNAVFKKQTGQTPSEYVRSYAQSRPTLAD
ncbi:helix-turn-helix domain-containing protein [Adhaeribacter radiodurans]|uniref:AraC family transcriptional regulator n=1 Tax=Adhaeribacter radiodurans TaxID=2745197 RepID=A0A7L7L714_9BACT|nr:helix-turn-helix domain-containing protein [Adhaeribacter radiodurans]QMU28632.1 AraC family transcriptional regulator [Adhaeribacter radiodurans]